MPLSKNINVVFISINNNNILITSQLIGIHLKNIFNNNNNNYFNIIKELIHSSDWIKKNYRKKKYSYLMNYNKESINLFIELISNIFTAKKKENNQKFFEYEFDKQNSENDKEKKIIIKYLINILKSSENLLK